MKGKLLLLFFVVFNLVMVHSQEPNYTTERAENGRTIITCPTEDDALILLNGYNLPDRFYFLILFRDIYFERVELFGRINYTLRGTKLLNAKDHGYERGLTIFNSNNYNVRRNTQYYILFDVEKSSSAGTFGMLMYVSNLLGVMDINLNPIN